MTHRLRIGIIAPEFPPAVGGMETMAHGLATHLAATDDVVVFTRPGGGSSQPGVRTVAGLACELRTDERLLATEKVDVWFALNGGYVPLAETLHAPFCSYLIGNDFLAPWVTTGRTWADRLSPIPVAWRIGQELSRRDRRASIRRGLRATAHVFALSTAMAALIESVYPGNGTKMSVVPPGVEDAFFQDRDPVAQEADLIRLLTVSRLTTHAARKNIDGVLEAIEGLPVSLHVIYTIVGDGDDRPRLERAALRIGCPRCRVRFAGRLSQAELLAEYRRAELFVLPVRATATDVEGFGIVYAEASASGLPVLASRAGLATDAIVDGTNGILLDSSSPEAIRAGLVRFWNERARYQPARVRAVAEAYRWTSVVSQVRSRLAQAAGVGCDTSVARH